MFNIVRYFRMIAIAGLVAILTVVTSCDNRVDQDTTVTPSDTPNSTEITSNEDIEYMTVLGLMKGHLIVGKELIDAGEYQQAEPHIGHPVEELYGDIEDQLEQRGVAQFNTSLNQLTDLVKTAPTSPEVSNQYQAVMQEIDAAIANLSQEQRNSPQFVMPVVNNMLITAADEYGEAIANNEIVEEVEYQDSRGFVIYADELYSGVSSQVQELNGNAAGVIDSSMAELKQAWPEPIPPQTPTMSPEEVEQLVETIKTSSESIS